MKTIAEVVVPSAIAINTLGIAFVLFAAKLLNRIAAIAVSSMGCGISILGVCNAIATDSMELVQARQEALYWAQEAQKHLTDKRDLLLKFKELDAKVRSAEAQDAIAMSFLEVDQEIIDKME